MDPSTFETPLTTFVENSFAPPNKRTTLAVDGSPYLRIMHGEVFSEFAIFAAAEATVSRYRNKKGM